MHSHGQGATFMTQADYNSFAMSNMQRYACAMADTAANGFQSYPIGTASDCVQYGPVTTSREACGGLVPDYATYRLPVLRNSVFAENSLPRMAPFEYQHLLAGVTDTSAPYAAPPGGVSSSFPISLMNNKDMKGCNSVSRSNKVKNKVQQLHPFYSRRLASTAPLEGRTRTRDKYRVVYTEKQRIGLEKAFKEDKFITMAKKSDLSKALGLSDRQIKIWFQNRRAKERRCDKKTSSVENADGESSQQTIKPSCRFQDDIVEKPQCRFASKNTPVFQEKELPPNCRFSNNDEYNQTVGAFSNIPFGTSGCGYGALMASNANSVNTIEQEVVPKCPEAAQRFQLSPSQWMDSYHQPMMNTVNISPFASSLDINFLSRT